MKITAFKIVQITVVLLCITVSYSNSQPVYTAVVRKKYWSIGVFYQLGTVLPTNKFVRGTNAAVDAIDDFQAFSAQLAYQTNGKHVWEQRYHFPRWGGGVYIADFFNRKELGYPIALYGFFIGPFRRWEKSSFNYSLSFGFTFNWEPFNAKDNQYNIAIGAGETAYIDLGMNYEYNFTETLSGDLGFSVTHFSNGALKKPNFGLNVLAPRLRLRYNLQEDTPTFDKSAFPEYRARFEYDFSAFAGTKQVFIDTSNVDLKKKYSGVYFPIVGFSAVANYHVSYKSKLGVGATLAYNGTLNAQLDVQDGELDDIDVPFVSHLAMSVYPSYELVVHRVSLMLQPGFYILRKKIPDVNSWVYYRIGIKYHMWENFFIGINLRANSLKESDFIEWSVGYRLLRNKKIRSKE
uniref:Acyloxyacyl hydrolase n=1 Tax=Roseihalotalea indica TaxID=2867963 RepID=A0AA49GMJ6_9BACT|nr:acyloxyacyl hydrolase [Tunicatimonas sp. TK19036]